MRISLFCLCIWLQRSNGVVSMHRILRVVLVQQCWSKARLSGWKISWMKDFMGVLKSLTRVLQLGLQSSTGVVSMLRVLVLFLCNVGQKQTRVGCKIS